MPGLLCGALAGGRGLWQLSSRCIRPAAARPCCAGAPCCRRYIPFLNTPLTRNFTIYDQDMSVQLVSPRHCHAPLLPVLWPVLLWRGDDSKKSRTSHA